jgi:hypothetical protein
MALAFRIAPFPWITGGQDEGVYVNMARVFEDQGTAHPLDNERETFSKVGLREFYDQRNYVEVGLPEYKDRWPYGRTLYGRAFVYDGQTSKYESMFLPLHTLWMSIFGQVFGYEHGDYSLFMFSLISIFAFSLLVIDLSGGNLWPGALMAFLLVISPLHSYFSKFPVSELVEFAFFGGALYSLARYYRLRSEDREGEPKPLRFYLALSCVMLFGCFLTRISSFVPVPALIVLLILAATSPRNSLARSELIGYALAALATFAIAIDFQLTVSSFYSNDIYRDSFAELFGPRWRQVVVAIGISILVLAALLSFDGFRKSRFNLEVRKRLIGAAAAMTLATFAIGLYRTYMFSFTPTFASALNFYHEDNQGLNSIWKTSIFLFANDLGYVGIFLFAAAVFYYRKTADLKIQALIYVSVPVMVYLFVEQWFLHYQYYYARYAFSEAYPIALMFICLYSYEKTRIKGFARNAVFAVLSIMSVIYLVDTVCQFKGQDDSAAPEFFHKMQAVVGPNDLLLFNWEDFTPHDAIATPLILTYAFHNTSIPTLQDFDENMEKYRSLPYEHIYLLTAKKPTKDYFEFVTEDVYDHGHMEYKHRIPHTFVHEIWQLEIYRFNPDKVSNLGRN